MLQVANQLGGAGVVGTVVGDFSLGIDDRFAAGGTDSRVAYISLQYRPVHLQWDR